MSSLSSYNYDTSLLFEFLILLDRLLTNYLGPVLYVFVFFYKAQVKDVPGVHLTGDFVIYLCFFFINVTRLTVGSYGNKSGCVSLIVWFWVLGIFVLVTHVYTLAGLQLLLTIETVFASLSMSLLLFQYVWSLVNLLLSNSSRRELEEDEEYTKERSALFRPLDQEQVGAYQYQQPPPPPPLSSTE